MSKLLSASIDPEMRRVIKRAIGSCGSTTRSLRFGMAQKNSPDADTMNKLLGDRQLGSFSVTVRGGLEVEGNGCPVM